MDEQYTGRYDYAHHMNDQRERAVDRRRPLTSEISATKKQDWYAALDAAIRQAQEKGHV